MAGEADEDCAHDAGEHIDYCGFSVLPAAIERDVLVAFSTASPSSSAKDIPSPTEKGKTVFVLRNSSSKFSPTSFEVDLSGDGSDLALPKEHHWSSYFIAGTKGILGHLYRKPRKSDFTPPERVLVLVNGTVPEGSGLSSSSAMTTASAIAVLEIVGRREGDDQISRRDVTNVAIESGALAIRSSNTISGCSPISFLSLRGRASRRRQLGRHGSIGVRLQPSNAPPSHVRFPSRPAFR